MAGEVKKELVRADESYALKGDAIIFIADVLASMPRSLDAKCVQIENALSTCQRLEKAEGTIPTDAEVVG